MKRTIIRPPKIVVNKIVNKIVFSKKGPADEKFERHITAYTVAVSFLLFMLFILALQYNNERIYVNELQQGMERAGDTYTASINSCNKELMITRYTLDLYKQSFKTLTLDKVNFSITVEKLNDTVRP
jgi:hypothetical protein